jgi:acyl carrier protein phosphodiesterase
MLAGDDPALIVGGVIGDWIKGPLPAGLPHDLARGVALHRAIDEFAESNPPFRRSRARVSAARSRYSGVLVDMFYDHLLAQSWAALDRRPLQEYCAEVYQLIEERLPELPPSSHPALALMAREDWLSSYARIEGLASAFSRMARRTRQPSPLAQSEQELLADLPGFTEDFHAWLADADAFCRAWGA